MPPAWNSGLGGDEQSCRLNGHLNIRSQSFCPQAPKSGGPVQCASEIILSSQVGRKNIIVDVFNILPHPFICSTGVASFWLVEIAVGRGSSELLRL